MKAVAKVGIHNRFDIVVQDAITGEIRQSAQAFNIVLDAMWGRLTAGSAFFVYIAFGGGTGTLLPSRTSLFSQIASKAASDFEAIKALPLSSWTRRIVLNPEEYVGQTIREVGIAYGSSSSNLVTHAMLQDSQGNPISIVKTSTDVVTIYATVFSTLSAPEGVMLVGLPNENYLVNYLTSATASWPTGATFSLGSGHWLSSDLPATPVIQSIGSTGVVVWSADLANKKRKTEVKRFGVTEGNGHIKEFGFYGMFRALLPLTGVFAGQSYADVSLGTGDGSNKVFLLPSLNVDSASLSMKVNGIAASAATRRVRKENARQNTSYSYSYSVWSLAVSPLKDMIACALGASLQCYISAGTKLLTTMTIAQPPSVSQLNCVRWSPDGQYLAVGHSGGACLSIYKRVGKTLTLLTGPASPPTQSVYGLAWSPDGGYLTVTNGSTAPYLRIYKRTGDGFELLSGVPSVNGLPWAADWHGDILALGMNVSPYLALIKQTGDNFALMSPPATMPTSAVLTLEWSPDGTYLAVGQSAAPFLTVYRRTGDSLAPLTIASGLPTATVRAVGWSKEGPLWLALASGTSLMCYEVGVADTFTPRTVDKGNLASATSGVISAVTWGLDGVMMAGDSSYSTSGSRYLQLYDMVDRTTEVTLDAVPGAGAAVTADYTVRGLHKTDQYVLDLSFAVQFGEVT